MSGVCAQPVQRADPLARSLAGLRWGGNKSNENGYMLMENHLHARPTTFGERKSALSRLCLTLLEDRRVKALIYLHLTQEQL